MFAYGSSVINSVMDGRTDSHDDSKYSEANLESTTLGQAAHMKGYPVLFKPSGVNFISFPLMKGRKNYVNYFINTYRNAFVEYFTLLAITTGIIINDVAQDGKIKTSNIVNGTLMVIGTVAMFSTAILSAPVIAGIGIGIAAYGVADWVFDIGGSLDSRYGQFNVNPLRP